MSGAPSGIGYGEAQIYKMDQTQRAFEDILQSQALQRQKEQKAIADQLKTLNTEGLREPDKDAYFKKYEEWQEASARFRTEKDRNKKYTYQTEAEKKFADLKNYVGRSKEAHKNDTEFASRLLDDRFRDQFKDDAVTTFQSNFKKSIDDPTYIADKSTLGRQINEDEFNKKINQLNETLLKKTAWSNPVEVKHTQGNRAGVLAFNKREVSQEEQDAAYLNLYRGDRDMRKFIADRYPQEDPETAVLLYAREVRQSGVLSEGSAPQFRENDNWREKLAVQDQYAERRELRKEARTGKTAGEEETTQRQQMVEGLFNMDPETISRVGGIVKSNPSFANTDGVKIVKRKDKPNLVTFIVPAEITTTLNKDGAEIKMKKPGYEVHVDLKNTNAKSKINELLNNVTGSKITNEAYHGVTGNKNKPTAAIVKNGTTAPKKTAGIPKPNDEVKKTDSVTVILNGKEGQIPASAWAAFKKKYPTAKKG